MDVVEIVHGQTDPLQVAFLVRSHSLIPGGLGELLHSLQIQYQGNLLNLGRFESGLLQTLLKHFFQYILPVLSLPCGPKLKSVYE